MQEENTDIQTIMFADVAGSTTLYEKIGDTQAQHTIANCLDFMTAFSRKHQGVLVKNIGDEILCRFPSAAEAVEAASAIQNELKNNREMSSVGLQVRIGLNTGPVILTGNDVFGDAVNVAARMAGLARAKQIICTGETIAALGGGNQFEFRQLNALQVKGKSQPLDIYEILWMPDDTGLTAFFSVKDILAQQSQWNLTLKYGPEQFSYGTSTAEINIGRSPDCDLVVHSPHASRKHAKLISRLGKLVFVDQSTNGSFVTLKSGTEVFVHMEELPIAEDGYLSLGIPAGQNDEHLIQFEYRES